MSIVAAVDSFMIVPLTSSNQASRCCDRDCKPYQQSKSQCRSSRNHCELIESITARDLTNTHAAARQLRQELWISLSSTNRNKRIPQ